MTKKQKLKAIEKAMELVEDEIRPLACGALVEATDFTDYSLREEFSSLFQPSTVNNTYYSQWNFDAKWADKHNLGRAVKNKTARLTALALYHAMVEAGDV